MSVVVRFLGTGSASAPGGRSHSCVLVRGDTAVLLLDCGASALPAITRDLDAGEIDAVLVSHLHGDHFGGIPFLLMEQHYAGRTRPLVICGPRDLEWRVRELALVLYPDFYAQALSYPVEFTVFHANGTDVAGVRVTGLPVVHIAGSDAHGMRVLIDGKLIAYSGDAEWSDALPALADGADLFICEATTYSLRWAGHLSAVEIAAHRGELRCARIVLTHLGPEAVAHRGDIPFEVADDGLSIALG